MFCRNVHVCSAFKVVVIFIFTTTMLTLFYCLGLPGDGFGFGTHDCATAGWRLVPGIVHVCYVSALNFLSSVNVRLRQGNTVKNEQCDFAAGRLSAAVLCGRRFLVSHCVPVNTHAAGSRR